MGETLVWPDTNQTRNERTAIYVFLLIIINENPILNRCVNVAIMYMQIEDIPIEIGYELDHNAWHEISTVNDG